MRCCCDDVGPELMTCKDCGRDMPPFGRSVGDAAANGYCGCLRNPWVHRSSLWPGERWGDALPCIGDVKCERKRVEEE